MHRIPLNSFKHGTVRIYPISDKMDWRKTIKRVSVIQSRYNSSGNGRVVRYLRTRMFWIFF